MSTSTAHSIASQILTLALTGEWPQGTHLSAQALADQLNVSRQPVNEALKLLESEGVVRRERYRGCFLEGDARTWAAAAERLSPADDANADDVTQAYFRIADDLLRGELPSSVSESLLKSRYDLSKAQLTALLQRIAGEGWIERRQGYGWRFATMLTTPDSLLQSYRLRLALEPAALMEPGYRISPDSIARCRAAELRLLNGGMDTDSADAMHERGVNFHESLVQASGNPFFIDAIGRVNRVRRLLSYRSMQDRTRYREHCQQHLHILELLEQGRNTEASGALRTHLQSTLHNLERISGLLQAAPPPPKEPS